MKLQRIALWASAIAAVLIVFGAYLRPEVALTLAQQLWSCF